MPPLSNDQGNFAHGSTSQPVAPAAVPGVPEFPLAEAYRPARESNSAPPAAPVLPRRRPLPTRQAPRVEDLPAPPRGYQNVPPPLAMPLPRTTPPRGLPALGPEASQRHSLGNVFPAASGVQNRVRPLPTRQAPRVEDLPAPPAGYANVPPPLAVPVSRAVEQPKYAVPPPAAMPLGDLAAAPRDYREAGSWVDAIGHEKLGWA